MALCTLGLMPHALAQESGATTFASAVYVRTDSDTTTVVTPRLRLGAPVTDATTLDLVYSVDVWTSASVDIRTAATQAVTEQRDEIDVGLAHEFEDISIRGGYRYSHEYDYISHGGSLGATVDLAQNNTSIALDVGGMSDQVGHVGDPDSFRPQTTVNGRASITQVLDTDTLVQVSYELMRQQGYLSSPYRYVAIGPSQGPLPPTCAYPVFTCIPEINPEQRLRHAAAVRARRALGDRFSAGLSYRFYLDDWDINSHTASADVAWVPGSNWLLDLGYRFYTQTAASHYSAYYREPITQSYYTSDKELSPLTSHRLSLEANRSWPIDDAGGLLTTVLSVAPIYYQYHDFARLDTIQAIEVTLSGQVEL